MQTQSSKQNIKRPSSKVGTNPVGRNERAVENGNSEGTKDDSAIFESEFHLLTKNLSSIPHWQIGLLRGTDDKDFSDAISIIDTEEKQLQAISDLWKIVKAQPKYKKLKEPNLKVSTEPSIVLQYILRKLGALTNGQEWNIDTYSDGDKKRFRFIIKSFYPTYKVRHETMFFPVDFLPALEIKDKQLHDMLLEVIALVSKDAKIPLWDEDGDFSKSGYAYTHGIPVQYLRRIKARRKLATRESVYAAWDGYKVKSHRQEELCRWIRLGLSISHSKDCIANHTYIPEYDSERERTITPFRNYKFIWSCHNKDLFNRDATKNWFEDKREYGQYWPLRFSITKPGQIIKPIPIGGFPCLIDEFLGLGEYYFTRKYQYYYYKNSFKLSSPW